LPENNGTTPSPSPSPFPAELQKTAQVAKRLNVSTGWVRDRACGRRLPKLPCIKMGRVLRFHPDDVDAWLLDLRKADLRKADSRKSDLRKAA
jgi:hypothetical protein